MAQVPQKTLNWLYDVLSNEYRDVDRTYSDVARTLSSHPNFSIRTDVYSKALQRTPNTENTAYRTQLMSTADPRSCSTSPVLCQYLSEERQYPRAAPITFVTPTKNMAVRAGQYVSAEGRVYHPYLAGWREDRSSIMALLSVLQEVFAREPPVVSRQEEIPQQPAMPQQNARIPPPVPPLPPELGRPESPLGQVAPSNQPIPPPRPPKASDDRALRPPLQANGAPPVPPHPGRGARESYPQTSYQNEPTDTRSSVPQYRQYQPQRVNSLRNEYEAPHNRLPSQAPPRLPPQHGVSPISPMTPLPNQSFPRNTPQLSFNGLPPQAAPQPQPMPTAYNSTQATWQQHPQHVQSQRLSYQLASNAQPPKPKPPQDDLLTSPFETALPVPAAEVAPPPIPPNPQKDALLQALSQTLTQRIQSAHASNMSAIPPLRAQQAALNETLTKINHEMSQLNDLQTLLDSNEKILRQAMIDADKVLDDAKRRDVPAVEDVLVAPTVVARQLYETVIEERVLEECRTVMGKALDKGRIGGDVWAKQTRSLAREEFLKKALIKKISRGMGLVEGEMWD
ncbi:MAG: hypothetical protein LQ338_005451 [Usnochroma carphineum]|nr:MAG: hypothetical protein LQ338_005451 [Usnochroma carphineum]